MNKTQENLLKAFAGESQARNKYTTFAKMARKENLEWIARVFEETAENERVHAEEEFELITGSVTTPAELAIFPFTKTSDNLKMAAEGEKYEWETMYPNFEEQAKVDNDAEATRLFGGLKLVEAKHEERYIIIVTKLDNNTLYNSEAELTWKCVNCGYIHVGKTPPQTCPVCKKPFTWYMPVGLVK
ncbi:MAG: rubrerythrin family protein [Candidatus Shapirobacteria bacterium]|nr:rubrerythrin family protein [Candidatus Shapirobacteria bacterium]